MAIYRGAGGAGDAVGDSASEALLVRELAIEVQADADAAEDAKLAAQAAQAAAETAETNAETAETNAETAETNAETAQAAAASSASAASTSATNAASSASAASTSATNAASSASSASTSASSASTSATNASNSASSASASATNASNSATAAAASASTASTQATNAASSATAASTSATNAASSATSASNSASTATTQAGIATTQATNASSSATAAASSASAAASSASAAATSETNAANSASSAAASATNSSNSATAAATSATNASNSATAASGFASDASDSADAAAASATLAASFTPSQTGNTGKYLTTDGTNTSWDALATVANSGSYNDLTDKPTLTTNLDGLTDVVITSPASDQVLKYNGTNWVNGTGGGSMVYPSAGIPYSNGTSWGTSYTDANKIPANFISTLNQNTTGSSGSCTGNAATATTASTANALNSGLDYTCGSMYAYNWFRSYNATGWYNQTYGGGINMEDTTWVRVYGSKAFYVTNTIASTGNVTAYYSDMRLKTKVGEIENALDKVKSLEGFYYVENDLAKSLGYKSDKKQVALSAQKVKEVMPEATSLAPFDMHTNEDGSIVSKSGESYLTVDYERLVPLLVEAIKELEAQVAALKAK